MDKLDLILKTIDDFKNDNSVHHKSIIKRLDKTNGNVKKNTEFRIEIATTVKNLKWLIGILGFGNVVSILSIVFK